MSQALVIATKNSHKTEEIVAILGGHFSQITDLNEFPDMPQAIEDGDTFLANAKIKALAASLELKGKFVLSDDSGLEVDALDGAPGVYSARYAGPEATDENNRVKLAGALARVEDVDQRSGRFRCVLVLAKDGQVIADFDGTCEGHIATEEQGEGGFGYDPMFVPQGYEDSFGVLSAEIKNQLSHRGRALAEFKEWLSTADLEAY
ncbi:MAG: RdgB/HAM1 family non-canonical purine NTP pyrophosphatase [Verrucomicrobiota bacterium]